MVNTERPQEGNYCDNHSHQQLPACQPPINKETHGQAKWPYTACICNVGP